MKRILCLIFCAAVITALCGCQQQTASRTADKVSGVGEIMKNAENSADAVETFDVTVQNETIIPDKNYPLLDYDADIDLTELNSTMVYSEVLNMMNSPQDYVGKKVKASGSFSVFTNLDSGKLYYSCVIADATACCQQGLEFVLAEERKFPDEFPIQGRQITVAGVFDTYEEDGKILCCLSNAVMSY